MSVTITIDAARLISDDGGDFTPVQGTGKVQVRKEIKKRRRHYRRLGNIVNVNNQRQGGEVNIDITGKP